MVDHSRYWNEQKECMAPADRAEVILELIQSQLNRVYNTMPFYRELYDAKGFHPSQVKSLDDFTARVPVVTKPMLREEQEKHPPFGRYLGFDESAGVRINGSSGTSGRPTFYLFSQADIDYSREVMAQALYTAGIRRDDIVQISTDFGMFMGGWGTLWGVRGVGAKAVVPGAGNAERHTNLLFQLNSTVLVTTPTFALRLLDCARSLGLDTRNSALRLAIMIGEPGAGIPGTKKILREGWNATVIDCASTSEMTPWATNVECSELNGMHVINDEVYTEIVRKNDSNQMAPEGESGGLVYTHLRRPGQPMIRFWCGDESRMTTEPCACGRTYPRLPDGVFGRLDDMVIVRGVNVYPSAIQRALLEVPGLGSEHRIVVDKANHSADVTIRVESDASWRDKQADADAALADLKQRAVEHLKAVCGVRFTVELVEPNSLERFDVKAKRVIAKA